MDRNEIAEDMLIGLTTALIRKGVLDETDIGAAAAEIEAGGSESSRMAAHLLRLAAIEAAAPDQSDWEARRRRAQMHVVADGGNTSPG
jgi:hypothetical protein